MSARSNSAPAACNELDPRMHEPQGAHDSETAPTPQQYEARFRNPTRDGEAHINVAARLGAQWHSDILMKMRAFLRVASTDHEPSHYNSCPPRTKILEVMQRVV